MKSYDHGKIEAKWRKVWEKKRAYKTPDSSEKPKQYVLDMFPYPSGEGLHVGHPKGYIATDIYSRYKKMKGFNILHPMGWDAFGLPAENYAIKNKIHPRIAVAKNIKRFKEQLSLLGLNYDWSREINTTDPEYYRWTQWIFLKLLEKGLAYQSHEPINWCPSCQTGLANEDLEDGKCERCGSVVEKRPMRQWILRITDYAERLLKDLDTLKWPESIKESQRNWIGKSEGAEIDFLLDFKKTPEANKNRGPHGERAAIKVFTTRPDTLFGATYLVLSPEHLWVTLATDDKHDVLENKAEVISYLQSIKQKTEIERTDNSKEKTGVELRGVRAINPANGEEIPMFVADYVLAHYGTGAIMAVPAHDERDFEFAKKFNLPIKEVVAGGNASEKAHTTHGSLVNSGKFDGMSSEEAKGAVTESVGGKMKTTYKLRDWVFSRQRYWGEPIPVIHCEKCGVVPVPEKDLPVKLPEVKSYAPTGTGESPLAEISKWVNVKCPKCKGGAKRETNTMPQWAGSCWYYLRFEDPKNKKVFVDAEKEKYWSPVDMYVGGTEHATRHLIYARFWHKFLFDIKAVNYPEPFMELRNQGLILAEDGRKMSKRFGNVVNPDDVVKTYGADTLRIYEMFMGPFADSTAWSTDSIIGSRRFIEKIWRISHMATEKTEIPEIEMLLNQTIKKVGEDIENFKFNTAISSMMVLANRLEKEKKFAKETFEKFLTVLAPFAPHVTEELWSLSKRKSLILNEKWPEFKTANASLLTYKIMIQIDGKVRGQFETVGELDEKNAVERAQKEPAVLKWLTGKKQKKVIYVKNKLVSIVLES